MRCCKPPQKRSKFFVLNNQNAHQNKLDEIKNKVSNGNYLVQKDFVAKAICNNLDQTLSLIRHEIEE